MEDDPRTERSAEWVRRGRGGQGWYGAPSAPARAVPIALQPPDPVRQRARIDAGGLGERAGRLAAGSPASIASPAVRPARYDQRVLTALIVSFGPPK
jgi:hypothetical protein